MSDDAKTASPAATGDENSAQSVFRRAYRELTDEEKKLMEDIKDAAGVLYDLVNSTEKSREQSLANTKLEESVMWAVKGITG